MTATLHSAEYQRFAAALASARNEVGISQYELARRLGVDQSYVSKYERGRRRLDVIEFLRIVSALGISYTDIIDKLPAVQNHPPSTQKPS